MRRSLLILLTLICFSPARAQEALTGDERLMILLEDSLLSAQFDETLRNDEVGLANLIPSFTPKIIFNEFSGCFQGAWDKLPLTLNTLAFGVGVNPSQPPNVVHHR